jgi:methionine-rich copper-binding protein CopC
MHSRPRFSLIAVVATAATAMLALPVLLASPALAHSALLSSDPAEGATVSTSLERVSLTYNQQPLQGLETGLVIEVRDAAGEEVTAGDVSVEANTMSRAVNMTTDGAYQVLWRYVSPDGHPVAGQYAFTYAGPELAEPAAPTTTATPPPSSVPATTPPATTPTAGATLVDSDTRFRQPAAWVIIGIAALIVVGIAVVALTRKSRTNAAREVDSREAN